MRTPSKRAASIVLCTCALAVATIGTAGLFARHSDAAPADRNKGEKVEVNIKNLTFIPDPVTIKVGQTVRWTNNDDRDYQLVGRNNDEFKSPNLRPKEKFEYTFKEAGRLEYFDLLHPRVQGTVIIEEK